MWLDTNSIFSQWETDHDRSFCDSVGFNTVGTVVDGSLTVEERDLTNKDWKQYDMQLAGTVEETNVVEMTPEEKAEDQRKRKLAFNAPKLIAKLEKKVEKAENKIAELDEEMMNVGNDVGKLTELSVKKQKEEETVAEMMAEWEEIEEVLAEMS